MLKKLSSLSLGFLLCLQLTSFAQKRKQVEYSGFFDSYYYRGPLNITVGAGTAGYFGDLGVLPGTKLSPGFHVGASYMVWPRTYFGAEFNYLTLGGLKSDTSGSITFTTNVYEFGIFGRFNLVDKRILFKTDIDKRPPRVRPYITLGIAGAYYTPVVTVTDTNFFKSYTGATSSNITLVLPASLGFAFYINKRFSILTEFGYRYTFTDGLDGISKLGASDKDSYVTAMLKIQYTFHPFRRKRAKYRPLPEGYGAPGSGPATGTKAPKDSTLDDPILPPGAPAAPADSSAVPITPPGGEGQSTPATPPADSKPKELTEEEKRKLQEEKEQLEWENSEKQKTQPADKKKPAEKKPVQKKPADDGWN